MIIGIPGLSALLYSVSVLVMPAAGLVRMLTGRSGAGQWRLIARHVVLTGCLVASTVLVAFQVPYSSRLPAVFSWIPAVTAIIVTVVLIVTLCAWAASRRLRLRAKAISPAETVILDSSEG